MGWSPGSAAGGGCIWAPNSAGTKMKNSLVECLLASALKVQPLSDHHLPKRQLRHWHRRLGVSKLDTACSQALCNWLRLGLAETGVAFNDILFEDGNPKIGNGHHQIV